MSSRARHTRASSANFLNATRCFTVSLPLLESVLRSVFEDGDSLRFNAEISSSGKRRCSDTYQTYSVPPEPKTDDQAITDRVGLGPTAIPDITGLEESNGGPA